MNAKTVLWIVIALAIAVVLGFALGRPAGGGIENVDAAGVKQAAAGGARVIDVRTPGEFAAGHIPGAINVPVDTVATAAEGWDRNGTYVVYCATGARSATAVETMKSLGFGKIKHFSEGMQAWDGDVEQGEASTASTIKTNGRPVFIEFFTDS